MSNNEKPIPVWTVIASRTLEDCVGVTLIHRECLPAHEPLPTDKINNFILVTDQHDGSDWPMTAACAAATLCWHEHASIDLDEITVFAPPEMVSGMGEKLRLVLEGVNHAFETQDILDEDRAERRLEEEGVEALMGMPDRPLHS